MIRKQDRRLKVGILGCGPIAQFAHFESAAKARNTDLYAICDVAEDLVQRMGDTYQPAKRYRDYDAMLADPALDAVIIATSDAFHVPAALKALSAGKHVLCEKPIGLAVEDVEREAHITLVGVADVADLRIEDEHHIRVVLTDVVDDALQGSQANRSRRIRGRCALMEEEGPVRLVRADDVAGGIDDLTQVAIDPLLCAVVTFVAGLGDRVDVRVQPNTDEPAGIPVELHAGVEPSHDGLLTVKVQCAVVCP